MGRRGAVGRQLVWLALACLWLAGAEGPAWRARRRPELRHNRLAAERIQPSDWPAEPDSPAAPEPARFAEALRAVCGWMPPSRAENYAEWTLRWAGEFGVDPFLLAALIYRESRCRADQQELGGLGLTLLPPTMYQAGFKRGAYHYQVRVNGRLEPRVRELPRFPFGSARLLQAEANLYLAAGLLAMWRDQHDTVDATFEQVPHRHYVSHWVWGDKVRSARAEDRVLGDRRRLLNYYGVLAPPPPIAYRGLLLGTPLDGAPRVVSSGLGSVRDSGERAHRGVDVESEFGERVGCIADGRVVFSGVDLVGGHHNQILAPEITNAYPRRELGRGGRYVCVRHGQGELRSCYMHLETVEVAVGQLLTRGERIGSVGRTGMLRSAPHLHLELHGPNELLDPLQILKGHLIGTPIEWQE
jgi:hypothetical protein